jgi:crotonobetaine/carnitine-CoA ligase
MHESTEPRDTTGPAGGDWWSSRVPARHECVLPALLERHARERPDQEFARFEDGSRWTFRDAWWEGQRAAARLRDLGVRQGDPVLSWLPNGADAMRVWFGANVLGAIYAPLNTAYRGRLLEHAISLTGARVLVVHPQLRPRLEEIDVAGLDDVVEVSQDTWGTSGAVSIDAERPVEAWDPHAIIFTSGTTGPSKGVICSYAHLATTALVTFAEVFGPADRYMVNLPLFHVGGTIGVYGALTAGGSVAIVERFDTARYWSLVRETGVTHAVLLGAMANFLAKQPHRKDDRDHPLRHVFMMPLNDDAPEFAARFGVDVQSLYNMTETSIPIRSDINPRITGACGRVRRGVDARLVDEHDREVPDGQVGELILRTDRPWAMNSGYWRMPDQTAEAWRNGWFHTGDTFRRDYEGQYFFVDRVKDTIRRRGENISSFDVEAELVAHPAIKEAAVVGVPSPHGEEDVLAIVATIEGETVDPGDLVEYLRQRMAHFMVPRYVRFLPELPKTPTNKIEKHRLRAEGVPAETWDREAAGVRVRAARLGGAPGKF